MAKVANLVKERHYQSRSTNACVSVIFNTVNDASRFKHGKTMISFLINVDVKIASKAIARRLESILPELIHPNQNGFIKGRSILDAVRTIDDILEFS